MDATDSATEDFCVGDWLVQPNLAKIRRGDEAVHITPRAMAVLVYLANAKGAVVKRNELLDAVWPRMAVTPDALSQCIVELRKAFRDNSRRPSVIETIPKVGIRLIARVAAADPAIALETEARPPPAASNEATSPDSRGARRLVSPLTAALTVLILGVALASLWVSLTGRPVEGSDADAPPKGRSIAVLPFSYSTTVDADVESFAEGLHAELVSHLAQISALDRVIAPTSTLRYRNTATSSREIGQQLNVATILESHVQRMGDTVRVVATLVDTETDGTISSVTYDRALTAADMFAIQSELRNLDCKRARSESYGRRARSAARRALDQPACARLLPAWQ